MIVKIGNDTVAFSYKVSEIDRWAKQNCDSYIRYEVLDMSDIDTWSGEFDIYYLFYFKNKKDGAFFTPKWT